MMEDRRLIENIKSRFEKINNYQNKYEERARGFFSDMLFFILFGSFWLAVLLGLYYSLKAFLGW